MNRQEVLVFAALPDGVWRYEPDHALVRVLEGDRRAAMGGGSLTLLYAAPASSPWSGMHVGSLYQNAGLYCASAGLGSYVHASGLARPGGATAPARRLARAHSPDRGRDAVGS